MCYDQTAECKSMSLIFNINVLLARYSIILLACSPRLKSGYLLGILSHLRLRSISIVILYRSLINSTSFIARLIAVLQLDK